MEKKNDPQALLQTKQMLNLKLPIYKQVAWPRQKKKKKKAYISLTSGSYFERQGLSLSLLLMPLPSAQQVAEHAAQTPVYSCSQRANVGTGLPFPHEKQKN